MSVINSLNNKQVNKILGMSTDDIKKTYASKDDQMLAGGASVFTVAGQMGVTNNNSSSTEMSDSEAKSKNDNAYKSQDNAKSQAAAAVGGGAQSRASSTVADNLGKESVAGVNIVQTQSKNLFGTANASEQKVNKLNQDAAKTSAEIENLQTEVDGLEGPDINSAYSLTLGGGAANQANDIGNDTGKGGLLGSKPSRTQSSSTGASDDNSAKIAEKQSQIESKSSSLAGITASIGTTVKSTKTQVDALMKNLSASMAKTQATQQKAETATNIASTAATAFGGVATVGEGVSTASKALVPPPPTTAAGTAGVTTGESTKATGLTGKGVEEGVKKSTTTIFKTATGNLTKLGKTVADVGKVSAKVAKWSTLAGGAASGTAQLTKKKAS